MANRGHVVNPSVKFWVEEAPAGICIIRNPKAKPERIQAGKTLRIIFDTCYEETKTVGTTTKEATITLTFTGPTVIPPVTKKVSLPAGRCVNQDISVTIPENAKSGEYGCIIMCSFEGGIEPVIARLRTRL